MTKKASREMQARNMLHPISPEPSGATVTDPPNVDLSYLLTLYDAGRREAPVQHTKAARSQRGFRAPLSGELKENLDGC